MSFEVYDTRQGSKGQTDVRLGFLGAIGEVKRMGVIAKQNPKLKCLNELFDTGICPHPKKLLVELDKLQESNLSIPRGILLSFTNLRSSASRAINLVKIVQ